LPPLACKKNGVNVTAQDIMQQRIQIEIELRDAESKLSALQVKAAQMADALDMVSSKIRYNAELESSPDDFQMEPQILNNRLSDKNRADLSVSEIVNVIEDLRLARQTLANLKRKKNKLDGVAC
jgi:hypothetical protein